MPFGEERGQSTVIGALFIFAFIVVGFSAFQAEIVPQQNEQVEVNHVQRVDTDVGVLQNAVVNTWADGGSRSAAIEMGTRYPARAIALNPPPPAGSLRTTTSGEITITAGGTGGPSLDLASICGYSSQPTTRSLVYEPIYNEYDEAPMIGYENTIKYRNYRGTFLVDSEQSIIQGTQINIVPLAGTISETSRATKTIEFVGGPSGENSVNNREINLTFPSRIPASKWRNSDKLFNDTENVDTVTSPSDNTIRVSLASDSYTVTCRGVGIQGPPPSGTG